MEFCLIAPTPVLRRFKRPREFALAQRLASDSAYYEHYRQRLADGAHVIVDNGAYEGELVSFSTLIGLCVDLKPSVVVAPDFMGRPKESRYIANEFMQLLRLRSPDWQTVMEVIHWMGDPWEYLQLYKTSKADWIGVPKRMTERVEVFQNFKRAGLFFDTRPYQPHHALGLNSMGELEGLAALKVFVSCDSQKPWKDWLPINPNRHESYFGDKLKEIDATCLKYV